MLFRSKAVNKLLLHLSVKKEDKLLNDNEGKRLFEQSKIFISFKLESDNDVNWLFVQ
jgi:hypothetical protein